MVPTNCPFQDQCSNYKDEELVEKVKQDKQCYVCLMERYETKILRYIQRISGTNQETAEDIGQDIFLKVYINLNEFNSELKFSSWLYRIAHNETINYWRRNKKRQLNISWDDKDALKNIIKDTYDTEENVYQKITNESLVSTIRELDEKYQTVIMLNYLEGKSYREIADVLKKPIGTIGTLINRAKKILARRLDQKGIDLEVATK